jgi:hypothetical protein
VREALPASLCAQLAALALLWVPAAVPPAWPALRLQAPTALLAQLQQLLLSSALWEVSVLGALLQVRPALLEQPALWQGSVYSRPASGTIAFFWEASVYLWEQSLTLQETF